MNGRLALCAILLVLSGSLQGCTTARDARVGAGFGVPIGPERVATLDRVVAAALTTVEVDGVTRSARAEARHPLRTLDSGEALVELKVPGLAAAAPPWRALGSGDSGRGLFVQVGERWVCVGIYLGRRWRESEREALNIFAHPQPSWVHEQATPLELARELPGPNPEQGARESALW